MHWCIGELNKLYCIVLTYLCIFCNPVSIRTSTSCIYILFECINIASTNIGSSLKLIAYIDYKCHDMQTSVMLEQISGSR